jgi:ABC-type microcin C transport system permease subunit YejB
MSQIRAAVHGADWKLEKYHRLLKDIVVTRQKHPRYRSDSQLCTALVKDMPDQYGNDANRVRKRLSEARSFARHDAGLSVYLKDKYGIDP